jgi:hypothetical protein
MGDSGIHTLHGAAYQSLQLRLHGECNIIKPECAGGNTEAY